MPSEKIIEGLRIAMQTELNGINFYKLAAEKTEDKKARQVFSMLANDETLHFVELKKNYDSFIKTGTWSNEISLQNPPAFKDKNPIFSDELKSRIKDRHFEMSALSIGALLESNSVDFYRKMAEETDNKNAKILFAQLVKWEENHLAAITKQLDLLKEEYWAQAQFTPLF